MPRKQHSQDEYNDLLDQHNEQSENHVFSVSELNQMARELLEESFAQVWIEGEISNWKPASSGHIYFTLKDADAQIRAAMFKGQARGLKFAPRDGMQVLVRAQVTLYAARGDYQIVVEEMREAGLGALQRKFEELKAKLSKEGLFSEEHKKPLPHWPQKIGVITSPTGAVIQDILTVLRRRFPGMPVVLFPVAVQGEVAPPQIVRAIELANQLKECDVLIVGRGGGSLEDLWAFNDERVAKAIFASELPIVSAVGHQTDFTIADFVADVRAPTPSAAAELLSPNRAEIIQQLRGYEAILAQKIRQRIRHDKLLFNSAQKRLKHPARRLQEMAQRLDEMETRLKRAAQLRQQRARDKYTNLAQRLHLQAPQPKILRLREKLAVLQQRLERSARIGVTQSEQRFKLLVGRLDAISPLATLARGYSMTQTSDGRIIRTEKDVSAGDMILTRLQEGVISSIVTAGEAPGSAPPSANDSAKRRTRKTNADTTDKKTAPGADQLNLL
ncbi:MAG TPA: exodeoxyribonuclease VII large subunit [Pseudomonadales bacterium]|nr:exodeoxyribonuclease VII large subunit [Pseudomonadales bacterium]